MSDKKIRKIGPAEEEEAPVTRQVVVRKLVCALEEPITLTGDVQIVNVNATTWETVDKGVLVKRHGFEIFYVAKLEINQEDTGEAKKSLDS